MPGPQKSNVFIKDGDKPSRFLLDLNFHNEQNIPLEFVNDKEISPISNREFVYQEAVTRLAFYPFAKYLFIICYKIGRFIYKASHWSGTIVLAVFIWPFRSLFILFGVIRDHIFSAGFIQSDYKSGKMATRDEVAAVFNPQLVQEKATYRSRLFVREKNLFQNSKADDSSSGDIKTRTLFRENTPAFRWSILLPTFNTGYFRSLAAFAVILFLLALPFKSLTIVRGAFDLKGKVLGASEVALNQIITARNSIENNDLAAANKSLESAQLNFTNAHNQVDDISAILKIISPLFPSPNLKLAANGATALEAGRLSTQLGIELTQVSALVSSPAGEDISMLVDNLEMRFRRIDSLANELRVALGNITANDLPDVYASKILTAQKLSALLNQTTSELLDIAVMSKRLLGIDRDQRYLFVFQNNNELRASGGFIGSHAIIDISRGKIKNMEIPGGGSYDTEAGLIDKIIAPEPLHLVNPLWHFWDANWWPDWPTTAKKLMWFLEKSDGPSVDGVISLTPTAFEEILKITGPIDLTEKYGVSISAENFWQVVQELAEQKPNITKKPKEIIGDMMNKIVNEIPGQLQKDSYIDLIVSLESALRQKQIMFYSKDEATESKIKELGWGGEVHTAENDYLMVVNTNIAGGKSDRKIIETISHTAVLANDGAIIDTLKIKREHTAAKNEAFVGVRNVNWLRIYVPAGSELISARGFGIPGDWYFGQPEEGWAFDPDLENERSAKVDKTSGTKIYDEAGKTVFANWSMIDPGESAEIILQYRIPSNYKQKPAAISSKISAILNDGMNLDSYSLLVQKQPGSPGSIFQSRIEIAPGRDPIWLYPGEISTNKGLEFSNKLTEDKYFAVVFK